MLTYIITLSGEQCNWTQRCKCVCVCTTAVRLSLGYMPSLLRGFERPISLSLRFQPSFFGKCVRVCTTAACLSLGYMPSLLRDIELPISLSLHVQPSFHLHHTPPSMGNNEVHSLIHSENTPWLWHYIWCLKQYTQLTNQSPYSSFLQQNRLMIGSRAVMEFCMMVIGRPNDRSLYKTVPTANNIIQLKCLFFLTHIFPSPPDCMRWCRLYCCVLLRLSTCTHLLQHLFLVSARSNKDSSRC